MAVGLKTHRFTVDEYHRMGEAGIFTEDDRVELLAGEVIEMSPIGPRHAGTVGRLTSLCASRFGSRAIVWVQNPILLRPDDSEPQPDVALLHPRTDFYTQALPEASDVYLLIEVADTSLETDRDVKCPLYARAGIPEVWLIDVTTAQMEVHRQPTMHGYQDIHVFQRGETITAQAFPDLAISIDALLG